MVTQRDGVLLLLLVGNLLPSPLQQVTAWEPYTPFPPSVYIHNRTIYWGCDADDESSTPPEQEPHLPTLSRRFTSVSCDDPDHEGAADQPGKCDHRLAPAGEAFLFTHGLLGNSNYFHFWTYDFLPMLSLIMEKHEFALPTADWETEALNETFVERLERPYNMLAFAPFTDPRNPTKHFFCEHEHFNFLLRLFTDDPVLLEDDHVYCFEPGTHVWPLVSGYAREGHHEGQPTKYAGLVWQTQLYVRQRIFGLTERCPDCPTRAKPVVVWADRPKYLRNGRLVAPERYMYSWKEILDQLRDEFDVRLLNAGQLEPRELVDLMDQADILLGVHGAALQNMVWMRPYRSVVEIRWPEKKKVDRNYEKMSTHLHHFWTEVELYHLNATQFMSRSLPLVDQQGIVDAVRQSWEKLVSFHSEAPGAGCSKDEL